MTLSEISFSKVKTEIEYFLKKQYNTANVLFSPASPHGQILQVMEKMYQMSFLYLKNAIIQFDLSIPTARNRRTVRNAALLAGHIPTRAISSTGAIYLNIKTGINIESEIKGSRFTIFDKTLIKNKTNGLYYSIQLGESKQTFVVDTTTSVILPIIQGRWNTQSFTGTGEVNQTFQCTTRRSADIENFNVEVRVNGEYITLCKGIYDMLPDDKSCVVRTGYDSGVDIIFGNSGFGFIPEPGANIEVKFLETDGAAGNIFRRTSNDWTFVDQAIDGFGSSIDIVKSFDVTIPNDINFGADGESIEFTRNIIPMSSNNYVLGTAQQYAYYIKRLGVFSHVNAYTSNGALQIHATPNVSLFKDQNADYFTVPLSAFDLDTYEKSKLATYLKSNGNILLTNKFSIVSPVLSYYVLYIFVITYSDADNIVVDAEIRAQISDYFLNLTKIERIPKLDLLARIAGVSGVYSADITIISKKNEDYQKAKSAQTKATDKTVVGIDPTLGDILFEANELPIIRGGFTDSKGIFYSPDINFVGPKSINIIHKGTIDAKNKNAN
jgi:hypothetical protein